MARDHDGGVNAPARVAVCGLIHESNAFASSVTGPQGFVRLRHDQLDGLGSSGTELGGAILGVQEQGAVAVTTTLAWGQSSGPVADALVEELIDELVDGIERARESGLDAVVVCLHGSMCSESDSDIEGTVLSRLREVVGDELPIVATLDWHSSVTARMVGAADALVGYRTYPHIDQEDRGREAAALALRLADGPDAVHASWRHPPMLLAGPRTRHAAPAMAELLARARQIGDDPRVLTWSVLPGFARSDNASTGAHVYVLATDAATADAGTAELAETLWARREEFLPDTQPLGPAILERAGDGGPLVLSDQGDNPGGGAAGDGTSLLALLERHGPPGSVVAGLFDPAAVEACSSAGAGAAVSLDVGGHTDGLHGEPVSLQATVEVLADGNYVMHSPTHPNVPVRIGAVARIRTAAGIVVVLTSTRVQNEDLDLLRHVGIDPGLAPLIAVKSNAHFRAAFEPIASRVIDVDTPGLSTPHLERLPYRAVPRPVFPLDRDFDWSAS